MQTMTQLQTNTVRVDKASQVKSRQTHGKENKQCTLQNEHRRADTRALYKETDKGR